MANENKLLKIGCLAILLIGVLMMAYMIWAIIIFG